MKHRAKETGGPCGVTGVGRVRQRCWQGRIALYRKLDGLPTICQMTKQRRRAPSAEGGLNVDMQELALRALVSGMAGRDEADLAALYDATVAKVFSLALRIVGERAGAEEVVADVYLQAWEQSGRYDAARGKVMHWLYMMGRTRALDHLRRRDSRAETTLETGAIQPEQSRELSDPVDILMGIQSTSVLYAALKTLEPAHRQLIALAFFRDMSHQEIAERTGIPLGTVKSVLRRSLFRLREILERPGAMEASYG
ncbi:MAG: RNA polymerase sigma factor [Chromatiales bacterium]